MPGSAPTKVGQLTGAHVLVAGRVFTVETQEERVARIKDSIKGDKRPAVSVSIIERHFGGPTIDPEAQTEIGVVLAECGFPLADGRSDLRPKT